MGILDDIKQAYQDTSDGVTSFVSDPLGELGRQSQQAMDGLNDFLKYPMGNNTPGTPPPKEDPRTVALRKRLTGEAKDFREGLQGYKTQQFEPLANQGREKLDDTIGTINHSANQRGMLYSGLRQGAESNSRGNMASMLARQRAEINSEANNIANTKDESAANVGLAGYGDAIKRADDAYSLAAQGAANRRQGIAQIGEGVGYGLGTLRAARDYPSKDQTLAGYGPTQISSADQYQSPTLARGLYPAKDYHL